MKKLKVLLIMCLLVIVAMTLVGCCGTRNNRALLGGATGGLIGQALGRNTESTLIGAGVGAVLGILSGDFNGDGCIGCNSRSGHRIGYNPPPRLMPPTGNAARHASSPRDRAYYRAKDNLYRREYRRWEREQAAIGRAEGELEALRNIQKNKNRFFTGH